MSAKQATTMLYGRGRTPLPLPVTPDERQFTWGTSLFIAVQFYAHRLNHPDEAIAERAAQAVFDLEKTRLRHNCYLSDVKCEDVNDRRPQIRRQTVMEAIADMDRPPGVCTTLADGANVELPEAIPLPPVTATPPPVPPSDVLADPAANRAEETVSPTRVSGRSARQSARRTPDVGMFTATFLRFRGMLRGLVPIVAFFLAMVLIAPFGVPSTPANAPVGERPSLDRHELVRSLHHDLKSPPRPPPDIHAASLSQGRADLPQPTVQSAGKIACPSTHLGAADRMSTSLLELTKLRRVFGDYTALHDVTLTLPPGRIGLLGPNGAGKSTLLKILLGLLAPSSGSGTVLGQPLGGDHDGANNWSLRRQIGFMPEAEALVPGLTGLEYVGLAGELCGMPRKQAERRAHEVLSYLQLEEARYRRVEEYSVGMKQRVKLAQALIHDPPLLLLDEPTSGLDPAGRDAMLKLIHELGTEHGKSVILSTHLLADVQAVCERVVIVAAGRVRGVGPVADLCAVRLDRFRLRVQGDGRKFRDDLLTEGVRIVADNGHGEWRVVVPVGWSNLIFFKLADLNGVAIRGLIRDDETLEELFLRSVNDAA